MYTWACVSEYVYEVVCGCVCEHTSVLCTVYILCMCGRVHVSDSVYVCCVVRMCVCVCVCIVVGIPELTKLGRVKSHLNL